MLTNDREVITMFRRKYPHINPMDVENIFQRAQKAYLDLTFPFQQTICCVPANRPRAWSWIYDCMEEITQREGASGVLSYSENGLSMTWDDSQISLGLRSRIVPKVGVMS